LGIGDWGLGIGDWAQSPIPNPHPQSPILKIKIKEFKLLNHTKQIFFLIILFEFFKTIEFFNLYKKFCLYKIYILIYSCFSNLI
jgi:hypothetical protein